MPQTVPTDVAAQLARLEVDMDCLDQAVIENGLVAAEALGLAKGLKAALDIAFPARGPAPARTLGGVVATGIEARRGKAEERRRRIAASGFELIRGDGAGRCHAGGRRQAAESALEVIRDGVS